MNGKHIERLVTILYSFSAIVILSGAFFKLQHYPNGNHLVLTGIIVGTIVSTFDNMRMRKIIKKLEERNFSE